MSVAFQANAFQTGGFQTLGASGPLQFVIGGVDRTANVIAAGGGTVRFARVPGAPATLQFSTYATSGAGYRPAIDQAVSVVRNGVTIFAGVLTEITERALTDPDDGFDLGVVCECTCLDEIGLLLRDTYTKTYAAGTTLKAVLQDLMTAKLTARGFTLDAAQPDGPALDGFAVEDAYIDDILAQLQTITGHVLDVSVARVLIMRAPGVTPCGFSLGDATGDIIGGVSVRQSRNAEYANKITVVYGTSQQVNIDDTFTGNGVATTWTVRYPPVPLQTIHGPWIVCRGLITEKDASGNVIQEVGVGLSGADYHYNVSTRVLTRNTGALPSGYSIVFQYAVQFPQSVTEDDAGEQAAHGVWTRRYTAPDVWSIQTATQLAQGLINRAIAMPKTVEVSHRKGSAALGTTVPITFSERTLNATFMIVGVQWTNAPDGDLIWTFECVAGSQLQASWLDYFKRGSTGSGSAAGGSIAGGLIPSLSGAFSGDVVATAGSGGNPYEASLRGFRSTAVYAGPALLLGRVQDDLAWQIVADYLHPSPRSRGIFFKPLAESPTTYRYAMALRQSTPGTDGEYYLVPDVSPSNKLFLGAPNSWGWGPGYRITGGHFTDLDVSNGLTAYGRTVKEGEWTDYTPAWSTSGTAPVIGNGTIGGRYTRIGKTVHFEIVVTFGSTSTFGSGNWRFSLPVTARLGMNPSFAALLGDAGGSPTSHIGQGYLLNSTQLFVTHGVNAVGVTATVPFTWTTSDYVYLSGTYEEA